MPAEFPEITYRAPIVLLGSTSELQPEIQMQWNLDIETSQFQNAATLASLVMLINESTGDSVELEYVSYTTQTRLLKIRPTTNLDRSTLYTVLVDSQVRATSGRKSKIPFRWQFRTAAGGLDAVSLLDPADYSVQSQFPTFYWSPVSTGTVTYLLQIDDRWDFGSVAYQATTQASSLSPSPGLAEDTTYYWRVRAYTASASGAWSEIRQFYYGTPRQAHASSRQTWYESDDFGLARMGWENGLSNQSAFPTISVTFTSVPAASYGQYVSVWRKAINPRNDTTSTYQDVEVSGTWTLSGSTLTFTPSVAIVGNNRYEVRINQYLPNTSGVELGTTYNLYFTSAYSPMYADARAIRSRFLSAENNIPDDLINFYIHRRSLEANARYYMYLQGQPWAFGDQPTEGTVRDSATLKSYGVGRWVEAAATLSLLQGILFENLRFVDSERQLGDYRVKLGPGFIKAMELAMQEAAQELDYWEDYLTVGDISRSTTRSVNWDPRARDWDASIRDLEGRRDNLF